MKKNKLYLVISILITAIIFNTAAICNQCGITPAAETSLTTEEDIASETASKTTQAQKSNTEETTSETTTKQEETATSETEETKKQEESATKEVSFTYNPKSGPFGTEVYLTLSEPITTPITVYYNGQELPKSVSSDYITLTVNIPDGASNGYFMLMIDGQTVKASDPFTIAAPLPFDLSILDIGPVSTTGADKIHVDIKNVGTGDLVDGNMHVVCQALGISRSNGTPVPSASDEWIKISMKAGEMGSFYPSMIIDISLNMYQFVSCNIALEGDQNPNNGFAIGPIQ